MTDERQPVADWAEMIAERDAEIARLKSELLQRDMTWLPAKDAEIAHLKAEIASKERQFQDYVTRMTSDGLEWLICDEPCKAMDARSGCHCAKARDEIARLKAEVERLREALEEAAKVAESYEPRCDVCPSGVAAAIRALTAKP